LMDHIWLRGLTKATNMVVIYDSGFKGVESILSA
jgi:hypothetical protein